MSANISIIVPVYETNEKKLTRCIKSLINQTYKEIEIIIVDDGSKNKCKEICDKFLEKDERIKVIHQVNKGSAGARNIGIKNASGKWIMFVDGDDWIEENTCEILINEVSKEADFVFFEFKKDFKNKSMYNDYSDLSNKKIYQTKDELEFLTLMVLNYKIGLGVVYAKMIKTKYLIEEKIFFDEELKQEAEDIEFCSRLFKFAKKIQFFDYCLYHYVYNENSISTSTEEKYYYLILNSFNKIKRNLKYIENAKFKYWYNISLLYVIIATALNCYFSPKNKEKYKERVRKFKAYLNNDDIKNALRFGDTHRLSFLRRCLVFLTKHNLYILIDFMGKVKYCYLKIK